MALPGAALAGKADDTLRFAYDQVPPNLDPYFNQTRIGIVIGQLGWDTLIYRDPATNEHRGLLAEAWRWVDDRTIEFDLRQGVVFSNGKPFDADDVVYTINYVADPKNGVIPQSHVDWIAGAEKIAPHRVRITLRQSFPAALEFLALAVPIMPNGLYADGTKGTPQKLIGTGPYRVAEVVPGQSVTFERNPNYAKDSPKGPGEVRRIVIRFVPDRQTQLAEVMSSGVDLIMDVASDQATALSRAPQLKVVQGETMRIAFLNLNTRETARNPALRDVRVRRALALAIDRDTIAKRLVGDKSRVLHAICFPTQFGCDDSSVPHTGYDPERAKALLREAGYADGVDIDFLAYRDRAQVEAIIGYLRAVGIRARLQFLQATAALDDIRNNKADMMLLTWGSYSINDASASVSNYFSFNEDDIHREPTLKALLNTADTVMDPGTRKAGYASALKAIGENALAIPLYTSITNYVSNKDLQFSVYPDELPQLWKMSWR